MHFIARALVSAAALAALSAQAEGLYVGGSVGPTRYRGPDIGGLSTDRSGTGGKLYGGYEITPNFSVEAGYANLGKASSDAGDVKSHGIYVDAVGKVPLSESFSALGRIGAFQCAGSLERLGEHVVQVDRACEPPEDPTPPPLPHLA